MDNFSKDQLRQLLDGDDYNEEALDFSSEGDNGSNDKQDNEGKKISSATVDDDSDISDYEDSTNSRENRYKTLADLGFNQNEEEDENISDNLMMSSCSKMH